MINLRPLLIIAAAMCFTYSYGQNLEVIAGGGAYTEGPDGSVAWTLGETVIDTYVGASNHVTQGFHQSDVYVVSIEDYVEIELSVYPNPTSQFINIVSDRPLNLQIYDISGALVGEISLINTQEQIDISELSRGTYMLNFWSNDGLVKSVKILKQ